MDDPLVPIGDVDQRDPGCARGLARLADERLAARHQGRVAAPGAGIDDVVHHCKHACRIAHRAPRSGHAVQRGGTRAFMEEHPVDRDQIRAARRAGHAVCVPDLGEQGARIGNRGCPV